MKQPNSQPKEKPWRIDAEWALKMQPYAIAQFYSKVWPGAQVIELDRDRKNELAIALDIGGADKMLRFPDGGLAFLGQRFRRWKEREYDDFTLRKGRPTGTLTEFGKIELALQRGGFIAGYYAYGHTKESEDGFIRFRILKFKELIEAIIAGEYHPKTKKNPNGSSTFYALPFKIIPPGFFLVDYAEDKPQQKLPF